MQGDLCSEARVKTAEIMGPFTVQAAGRMELLVHRLHHLAYPSHPAPEPLGPWRLAMALGRTDDLGSVAPPPPRMRRLPLKAFVDHIRAQGRGPHTQQPRVGLTAQGKKGVGQRLVLGAGRSKAKAGDYPNRIDRQQQMEAFIPAQPIAPPAVRQTGQPTRTTSLGIPRRDARAVQGFIGTVPGRQELDKRKKDLRH